jgi:hypothetical protein
MERFREGGLNASTVASAIDPFESDEVAFNPPRLDGKSLLHHHILPVRTSYCTRYDGFAFTASDMFCPRGVPNCHGKRRDNLLDFKKTEQNGKLNRSRNISLEYVSQSE